MPHWPEFLVSHSGLDGDCQEHLEVFLFKDNGVYPTTPRTSPIQFLGAGLLPFTFTSLSYLVLKFVGDNYGLLTSRNGFHQC